MGRSCPSQGLWLARLWPAGPRCVRPASPCSPEAPAFRHPSRGSSVGRQNKSAMETESWGLQGPPKGRAASGQVTLWGRAAPQSLPPFTGFLFTVKVPLTPTYTYRTLKGGFKRGRKPAAAALTQLSAQSLLSRPWVAWDGVAVRTSTRGGLRAPGFVPRVCRPSCGASVWGQAPGRLAGRSRSPRSAGPPVPVLGRPCAPDTWSVCSVGSVRLLVPPFSAGTHFDCIHAYARALLRAQGAGLRAQGAGLRREVLPLAGGQGWAQGQVRPVLA